MNSELCRWGILSSATIAQKNWRGIYHSGNGTVAAVASRDVNKAQQFIDECQSQSPMAQKPEALGSYEALLQSDQIDAVYLPLPTGARKEWVLRAAEAGKHVLAEKPAGVTVADVEEIIDACRRNNVQYMDGVMFMHSDRLPAIRQVLDAGEIGELRRVTSSFSFNGGDEFLAENIRLQSQLEPAGCVGDLGWYNIRFMLWLMQGRLPDRVSGRVLTAHKRDDSPQPVPAEFSGEIFYDDGPSCTFHCSFLAGHQQWVNISGADGYVHLPDFVLPFFSSELEFTVNKASFLVDGCDFNMEHGTRRHTVQEYATGAPNSQETKMLRCFADIVGSGSRDDQWSTVALNTQKVLDACLASAASHGQMVDL